MIKAMLIETEKEVFLITDEEYLKKGFRMKINMKVKNDKSCLKRKGCLYTAGKYRTGEVI